MMRGTHILLPACLCVMACLPACNDEPPPAGEQRATQPTPAPAVPEPGSLLSQDAAFESQIDTSALDTPPADDKTLQVLGLTAPKSATWLWKPPTRTMRKANFVVPGRDGSEAAELVVNHFPEAPGNTLQANIARWSKQFRMLDGGTPTPIVTEYTVDTMPVAVIELHGEYMGMGSHWHQPNQRMLMSMVTAPAGTVFIKLLGPDATVEVHRDAYMKMILGLERTE